MDEEEIEEVEIEEVKNRVTDLELQAYLADRFDSHPFPGDQKIKPTAKEQLDNAEKRARGL